MKNRLLPLCLALLLLTCACAKTGGAANVPEDLPAPVNEWTVTEGITLRLQQSAYPEGVERMTLIMENRTDSVMLYGNGWSYERWENGAWEKLADKHNAAVTAEGYTLFDHHADTFYTSTFALQEPLKAGLYRVTGCPLRVAQNTENFVYGGNYIDYPAYRLEFLVRPDAQPEPAAKTPDPDTKTLRQKQDWEWYTPGDCFGLYKWRGDTAWRIVQSNDGLVAVLWKDGTVDDGLAVGELLGLDLFDRRTGEIFSVFPEPQVKQDHVWDGECGGFNFSTAAGEFWAGKKDGSWTVTEANAAADYTMETSRYAYALGTEQIDVRLANNSGKHCGLVFAPALERMTASGWEKLAAAVGFCGMPDPFPPGELEHSIPLSLFEDVTKGVYRLSFTVNTSMTDYTKQTRVSAIFALE